MIRKVQTSTEFTDIAVAFFLAFYITYFTSEPFTWWTVFFEHGLYCESLFLTVQTEAEAINNDFLMFYAYFFLTGFAVKGTRFVFNSVVSYCSLGLAFRADYVIGRVSIVSHWPEVLFDDGSGDEGNIYFWVYDTFKAEMSVVPIQSVEFWSHFAANFALHFFREEVTASYFSNCFCIWNVIVGEKVDLWIYIWALFFGRVG